MQPPVRPRRMRVAIVGGPRTGKTTLARRMAERLDLPLVSTDDFIPLGWAGSGAKAAEEIAGARRLLIEGVAVPRALRRLLQDHPRRRPIERLILLTQPRIERNPGQEAMAKGLDKILGEILPRLRQLGVVIERRTGSSALTRVSRRRSPIGKPPRPSARDRVARPGTRRE